MTDVRRDAHDQARAPRLHTAARRALTGRRREMWVAVGAGLLGASLAAAAGSMTWLTARILIIEGVAPVTVRLSGGTVQPGSAVLAAAALAAGAGVVATRRWGRLVPGLALLGVGLWVAVGAVSVLADPRGTAADSETVRQAGTLHVVILSVDAGVAPAVAAAGGVLMAVAGLLVLVRGWRWGSLGQRYQLPATASPSTGVPAAGAARADGRSGSTGGTGSAGAPAGREPVAAAGTERSDANAGTGAEDAGGGPTRRARAGAFARGTTGVAGVAGGDTDTWRAIEDGEDPTQEP